MYISIVVVGIEIKLMAVAVLGFSSRSYLTVHRPVIYCFHKVSPQLEKPFIFYFLQVTYVWVPRKYGETEEKKRRYQITCFGKKKEDISLTRLIAV